MGIKDRPKIEQFKTARVVFEAMLSVAKYDTVPEDASCFIELVRQDCARVIPDITGAEISEVMHMPMSALLFSEMECIRLAIKSR